MPTASGGNLATGEANMNFRQLAHTHRHGLIIAGVGVGVIGVGLFIHARNAAANVGPTPAGFVGTPYTQVSQGPQGPDIMAGTGSSGDSGGGGGGGGGASPGGSGVASSGGTSTSSPAPTAPSSPAAGSSPAFPILTPDPGYNNTAGSFAASLVAPAPVAPTSFADPTAYPVIGSDPLPPYSPKGAATHAALTEAFAGPAFTPTVTREYQGVTYYGIGNAAQEAAARAAGYQIIGGKKLGSSFNAGANYAYRK